MATREANTQGSSAEYCMIPTLIETGDLNGFELVICAVGEDNASQQIYTDAHKARILINVVGQITTL